MSTQLAEYGEVYAVSTVTRHGKQRRIPRKTVLVPKGNPDLLRAEIVRQVKAARVEFGVEQKEEEPVV